MKKNKSFPIVVAYLIFVALGTASGLLNIAWTYMQPTFEVSLDSLGTLLGAIMFGGLIGAFMSGTLIGRYSIGPFLVGGMLCAGIGVLGYALAPLWLVLLAVAFLASIGKGSLDAGLNNFASANYDTSHMNWLHACWGIGLTFAPAIVTYFVLDLQSGWQSAYVVMGLAILLLGVAIFLTLPQWKLKESIRDRDAGSHFAVSPSDTLRRPIVLVGLVFFFVYGGIEIGVGQLANTLLVESRGIPQETSSAWISAYWGSFTVGRILMGMFAIRIGDKILMNFSFILSVAGAICLFSNIHEILSLVGLLAIGFGIAAVFPILILQTSNRVGSAHAANAIGFQIGCTTTGGAVLSGIAGVMAERLGSESISLFILLCALAAALLYHAMIWQQARALPMPAG